MTGKITHVRGNVCEPLLFDDNEVPIIPHCCNNLGQMGKGVALSIRQKWPGAYTYYKKGVMQLGAISAWVEFTQEDDPPLRTPTVCIFNMIGQDGVVSQDNPKPVKYWALAKAMMTMACKIDAYRISFPDNKFVIHCPKFGSDLAGGNWDFIFELIKEIWVENRWDVVIYEFEPDKDKWGIIE